MGVRETAPLNASPSTGILRVGLERLKGDAALTGAEVLAHHVKAVGRYLDEGWKPDISLSEPATACSDAAPAN